MTTEFVDTAPEDSFAAFHELTKKHGYGAMPAMFACIVTYHVSLGNFRDVKKCLKLAIEYANTVHKLKKEGKI